MRIKGAQQLLCSVALACMLCGCATDTNRPTSNEPPKQVTDTPRTDAVDTPEVESPRSPQLVQDEEAPVAQDLQRLVKRFVSYAIGDSDTFPLWESVSMAIGGKAVLVIDDIAAELPNREIWKICPADWEVYGASSCPVDLLGPITDAGANEASIVYSAEYSDVTCAPNRGGPLPRGRLVVLRPSQEWRTCASDYALVLAADRQGQLRSLDLTLSEP